MNKLEKSNFLSILPDPIKVFLKDLESQNFIPTLVGGSVRDFLLARESSGDFDIEVSYKTKMSGKDWENQLDTLALWLSQEKSYDVRKLSFLVYKVTLEKDVVAEIASPRLEYYSDQNKTTGHSEMETKFFSQIEACESFLRRDFTMNSIGMTFNSKVEGSFELIDPFDGVADIEMRLLKTENPNFFNDPVRLLRLIRFSLQLDFSIEINLLEYFNLEKVTFFYLKKEAQKVDVLLFLKGFFTLVEQHEILIPQWLKSLARISRLKKGQSFSSFEQLFIYLMFEESYQEEAGSLAKLLQVKRKKVAKLMSLKSFLPQNGPHRGITQLIDDLGFSKSFYPKRIRDLIKLDQEE